MPWSELVRLGLDHDTPTYVWVASSSSPNSLNGDYACENAATGPAHLDGTASDATTGDPANEGSGGPGGPLHLEGGGGCNAGGGAAAPCVLIALAGLGGRRAKPRRTPRGQVRR